jgi:hypothetical protein
MPFSARISFALIVVAAAAEAQVEKKLTARELFYTPVETKAVATTKPAASKPPQAAQKTQARPSRPSGASTTPKEPSHAPPAIAGRRPEVENIVKQVSNGPDVAGPPLALRYSLLKQNNDGDYVEVDPETVFRSGDRIKVSVESNDTAHLYVVQQGSSKAWNVLFPNDDTEHGDNRVERSRRVTIPSGGRFTFDEQPGTERLFIVLSRRAEPDLEKMIYDLSRKGAAPAATPAQESRPKMMIAQNRIDDSLVNRLRGQMISRDLVFEKVDDEKPAPTGKREKAMYYGTEDRSSRARIVVDLNLRHQ